MSFQGGHMGRMDGYFRGKTKLECDKNFRWEVDRKGIEESTWTRGQERN